MANQKHIEWLLEGVDAWNARREREDFQPDFAGVDISGEFGKRGKLGDDGLVCLRGINLSGADLRKADLRKADLRKADLSFANLTETMLFDADLAWANLSYSQVWKAKLYG